MMLYNALFLPHLNYGILSWGHERNRIFKLQKKVMRIICLSKYNAHTEPLFKELNILRLAEMHRLQEVKFFHKFVNKKLPSYFQMLPLQENQYVHNHNTRHSTNLHFGRANHKFATQCVRFTVPRTINNLDTRIRQKFVTHSLQGFSNYVKNIMINEYSVNCDIRNCYICQNT